MKPFNGFHRLRRPDEKASWDQFDKNFIGKKQMIWNLRANFAQR